MDQSIRPRTQEEEAAALAADHQYNRDKTDPAAFDRLIHDMHADEVRVVRAIGGGL